MKKLHDPASLSILNLHDSASLSILINLLEARPEQFVKTGSSLIPGYEANDKDLLFKADKRSGLWLGLNPTPWSWRVHKHEAKRLDFIVCAEGAYEGFIMANNLFIHTLNGNYSVVQDNLRIKEFRIGYFQAFRDLHYRSYKSELGSGDRDSDVEYEALG